MAPNATFDAPDGDTAYNLLAPPAGATGFVLECGNRADGERLYVANVDPANAIRVEWQGSFEGTGALVLSAKGDAIIFGLGDITRVIVQASAYPTLIAWAYLPAKAELISGSVRTT